MQLELRFFATFRADVGQKTVEREYPDGSTVGDVLAALEEEYEGLQGALLDEDGEIREQLSVLRNGREVVHLEGAETPLSDGDTLSVFPPVAGGDGTATREKAFRGISLRLAKHYLENLGGEVVSGEPDDASEAVVEAEDWRADLSAEKVSIHEGSSMQLTEVSVVFESDDEDALESIVERFSQKAMRAGG